MTDKPIKHVDIEKLDKIFPKAYFEIYYGCNEPKYDDKPVILGDWNYVPNKVFDKLESLGYSCEWSDEWTMCNECYNVVRTSPDSWGWEAYYVILNDCDLICGECLDDYISEYLESIENEPTKALTCTLFDKYDPSDYGYTLINDSFENGWYPNQNDNPTMILENLLKNDPTGLYVFVIIGQGQFDIDFSVYKKE